MVVVVVVRSVRATEPSVDADVQLPVLWLCRDVAVRGVFVRAACLVAATSALVVGVVGGVSIVCPDVVALELRGLVAHCQGAGWFGGLVVGRVGVIVVTVFVVEIRERNAETTSSGVAVDGRTRVVVAVWSALAGASVSEVQVGHCWLPGEAGLDSC